MEVSLMSAGTLSPTVDERGNQKKTLNKGHQGEHQKTMSHGIHPSMSSHINHTTTHTHTHTHTHRHMQTVKKPPIARFRISLL